MFDLGDELIIGSHRVPWLIWIQLLVMLLLIILLYYFSISAFGLQLHDLSPAAACATRSSSRRPPPIAAAAACPRPSVNTKFKVGDSCSIKGEIGTSTNRRNVGREDIHDTDREGSSLAKDATQASVLQHSHHPCHFLGLAKQLFLKCFGLDPPSNDSSRARQRNE
ncbi:uncharacterized protein LOC127803123 [Diospyros lotus]|uniref:uncharacterized protein LOC127803123 n=1 Tax=Diospyros lotus TaxID=55363 RepID=UPI00224E0FE9|nr:uncharacterized protein LOC127803123 [Diospyros lotus]